MTPIQKTLADASAACEEARMSLYMAGDQDDALINLLRLLRDKLALRATAGAETSPQSPSGF